MPNSKASTLGAVYSVGASLAPVDSKASTVVPVTSKAVSVYSVAVAPVARVAYSSIGARVYDFYRS